MIDYNLWRDILATNLIDLAKVIGGAAVAGSVGLAIICLLWGAQQ